MEKNEDGFYSLSQIASCRKTEKQREHIGVLPLSKKQIGRLVNAGKFPAPAGRLCGQMIWRKADIRAYEEGLIGGGINEALETSEKNVLS